MSKKPVTTKTAAYENPLIPNARLKQMYRAILRAHLLGQSLPPAQRALTAAREAALVSTALDLTPRDLVLDAFSTPVLDFLRKNAKSKDDRVPHSYAASSRTGGVESAPPWIRSQNLRADAGSPSRLASPSDPAARIHAALGAASALKATAITAKSEAKKYDSAPDLAVVLSISISGEVPSDIWKSTLAFAAEHDLPVIFVVLPRTSTSKRTPKPDLRALAHRARVPAMPVDAADPVALYRVAQESIGHARIGGGPALIECVAFPRDRAPHKSGSPAAAANAAIAHPAIAHLADYILSRSIGTRAWFDREAASFAAQLRSLKSLSLKG